MRTTRSSGRENERWQNTTMAEHLRPLVDSQRDAEKFCRVCEGFARADIPDEVLQAMRAGRMTALQKPTRGVRGVVVGDFVRRLVARTVAQQFFDTVQLATAPSQFAQSTKASSECIAHVAQALTDMDASATLLSVDGIGAFDFVSRGAMMRGLMEVEGGGSVLLFVRQFYGTPSTYRWDDDEGVTLTSLTEKAESKAMHSCRCCSPSVCTGLCAPSETGSSRQNVCWHFWTTSMRSAAQTRSSVCVLRSKKNCGPTPGFKCTKARPSCGTTRESPLPVETR